MYEVIALWAFFGVAAYWILFFRWFRERIKSKNWALISIILQFIVAAGVVVHAQITGKEGNYVTTFSFLFGAFLSFLFHYFLVADSRREENNS